MAGERNVTRYVPIFDLSVRHSYYADMRCPDFEIEASSATEQAVRNHRLVLRTRPDGVRVVGQVDDIDRPFIPLDPDARFEWHLRVGNADLALITEQSDFDAHRIARYSNTGTSGPLVADEHPRPDRLPAGIFATVEITPGPLGPLPPTPNEFTVEFNAATVWWSYYLLTDLPADSGSFSIVDTSPAPLSFGPGARDLVADPDPADTIAADLANRHPAARRFRFRSDRPVASRNVPRHKIELRLGDRRVAGPLPIPKPSSLSTIPMTVGDGIEALASVSQIVRYPDRPPANNGV